MNYNICPRCHSKFYAALSESDVGCPFCGYVNTGNERRGQQRAQIIRDCDILVDGVLFKAMTIDVSVNGMALELKEELPLNINDKLQIHVHDFDIETESSVVWLHKNDKAYTSLGVSFSG